MNKIYSTILFALIITTVLSAEASTQATNTRVDSVRKVIDTFGQMETKEVSEVDKIKNMFQKGKASGQLKIMYAGAAEVGDAYATAIGGILKYELAEYRGFNAGIAFYTSNDIPFASGKGDKRNSELSSSAGNHTEMGEAYINYSYENLNLRAGRQTLDTPLADSDDIRMIQNTFEAYVATYDLKGIEFIAGNIQNWHGTDADLDAGWSKTGKNGTNFGGASYANGLEFDAYYYNITNLTNAAYFDVGIEYTVNEDILLHAMAQYLHENELDNSGVAATIYGALVEVVVHGIGFNLAVNKAEKKIGKESFSGVGGGALFTSMDTMILDEIAIDRDAFAYVLGLVYTYKDFEFLYAYGDFSGDADTSGAKAHIIEQDIGMGYSFNEEFILGALYAHQEDKESSANDWNRAQVVLNYNF